MYALYIKIYLYIKNTVNRNWNILQLNAEFHGVFQTKPMIALKLSRNLEWVIGGHTVKQGKVFKKSLHRHDEKGMSCNWRKPLLCCVQIVNKQKFISQQTK